MLTRSNIYRCVHLLFLYLRRRRFTITRGVAFPRNELNANVLQQKHLKNCEEKSEMIYTEV